MSSSEFERISYDIAPKNYNVTFNCDLEKFVFYGTLLLDVEVKKATDTLQLNVKEVKVSEPVTCGDVKGTPTIETDKELVTIKFDSTLPVGEHVVKLNFEGIHNEEMKGFYRSKYSISDKEEVYILCTQFESTSARQAFPCIDEPDRKATFEITLVVPENLLALSNMPEVARTKVDKPANLSELEAGVSYVEVKFDKTPIMSTYLVAMVVGNFECIEDRDANGIPIRVFTPIGKKSCASFAMEVALKCLPFYTESFGIGYPLPKLDLIAIPDFAMGAMENWGLVTYREVNLLIDPNHASSSNKLLVCRVVAHELAHMWFGNLVTMKWWTHLWLNEGFARWCEFYFTSNNYKEFDAWSIFASEIQEMALSLDGLNASHPIEAPVKSPDQIEEIFDAISYAKGASVINMLYNHIGKKDFFAGLKDYMENFKYQNTESTDLWNAFSRASNQDIAQLMSRWTGQQGYPVVEVTKKDDKLTFKQFRYLAQGSEEQNESSWTVFFKLANLSDTSEIFEHIKMSNDEYTMNSSTKSDIIVNPSRSSFIRVKYDKRLLSTIELRFRQLDQIDRMSFVSDLFSLATSGHESFVNTILFSLKLCDETSYCVWNVLYSNLNEIFAIIHDSLYNELSDSISVLIRNKNKFISLLAGPIHQRLGWEPRPEDNHCDILLKFSVISALGISGQESIITEARRRFQKHYEASTNKASDINDFIHPDLREAIYKIVFLNYSDEVFEMFIQLIKDTKMQEEKVRFYNAIGYVRNVDMAKKVVNYCLSDAVRKQDRFIIFKSLVNSGPEVCQFVWNYFKENVAKVSNELGSTTLLGRILNALLSKFTSMEMHNSIQDFLSAQNFKCEMAIRQGLERIIINNQILLREGDEIKKYLTVN